MESGDIYLYNNRGRGWGSYARPVGTALVVIDILRDSDGEPAWVSARDALNLTTYRVYPDQLDPVPDGKTVPEALHEILDTLLGKEKSAKFMRDRMQTYESLVSSGRIPPIDEARVVRPYDEGCSVRP
ncbi:hypothetical protein D3C71_216930 [compost metagenome]